MNQTPYDSHPYAEIFPAMTTQEFDDLCADIAANGLQDDIVLFDNKVLEGRHRYKACLAKQVPPRFRHYQGECGSPLAFVVSKNLKRRHLSESQRAMLAARLKPMFEEDARGRQQIGLKKGDTLPVSTNWCSREKHGENVKSSHQAAQIVKVGSTSVERAEKVMTHGVPELIEAVDADQVAVSAAAQIAELPAEQQQQVVADIRSGVKPKHALTRVQAGSGRNANELVDDAGEPLPPQALPAFEQRHEFRALCRQIDALLAEVTRLGKSPAGLHINFQGALAHLRGAKSEISSSQPSHVCPYCHGKMETCKICRGQGWVTRAKYQNSPKDEK